MGSVAAVCAAGAVAGGLVIASSASSNAIGDIGRPGTPPARSDAAIGYDPDTQQVVLFGGQGIDGSLGDTWIWDGSVWRPEYSPESPPASFDAAMVFDPKLHALVLIGGESQGGGGDFSATWLWSGHGWEERHTAHVPNSAFAGTGLGQSHLGYDAETGRVVLVGIPGALEFEACSAITWTFDGTDWRLEHPATPLPASVTAIVNEPQSGHVLALLSSRDAVDYERGDQTCPVGSSEARALAASSTWRWTGSTWVEVSAGSEPGAAVYGTSPTDGTYHDLEVVAGTSMVATGVDEAFWSWNGKRWMQIPGAGAGLPQTWVNMQSIDADGDVVVFGGSELPNGPNSADTWLWNGATWRMQPTAGHPVPTPFVAPPTQDPSITTPAAV